VNALESLQKKASWDGVLGKVVKGLAVSQGGEYVDAALDYGIGGGQRGKAEEERTHEHCEDGFVSHTRLLVQRMVGTARPHTDDAVADRPSMALRC
jgi:hypothetical protein